MPIVKDSQPKKLLNSKIIEVPLSKLKINPYQTEWYSSTISKNKDKQEKSEHLLESIKKYGVKTPLKITKDYTIIGGHRRHLIALQIGLLSVPCQMALYDLSSNELKLHTIEDNYLQRETGGAARKKIHADLIEIIKKEFPEWGYMVRDPKINLNDKLRSIGVSPTIAKKIVSSERGKAKKEDNYQKQGVIESDYKKAIYHLSGLRDLLQTTNPITKRKIKRHFSEYI